ncbi:carbonic anhydrase [Fuchsiella alkaliacetigena]|uniref:carbonic anhydrase n=1 Tax=Fuchsiella alkaliacetigena TaxID=957042 RepID=UPI00200B91D9|nr:carbonic anhydrase [Fuchsiella alkaliacetigena]MCK8823845.1 hypothetical protein [Fuchsiella alkaliacetigena]
MEEGSFVTAINCIDGRVQLPVINWLHEEYGVDYVDMITEPGPNLILADEEDKATIKSIKNRVEVSTKKHNSELIAVIGHYDCAANLADKTTQIEQIKDSIELVNSWNLGVEIIGLWVNRDWQVETVV